MKEKTVVYQQALCGAPVPNEELSDWSFEFPPEGISYRGLFPRAWTEYDVPGLDLKLTCRQISPVIPGDYEVSHRYHSNRRQRV